MPALSLVVCVYNERDLLARLLREAEGCYDDLVVVHDGSEGARLSQEMERPAAIDYSTLLGSESLPVGYTVPDGSPIPGSIRELVEGVGGRYFEGGRSFQQEPHWPFAWSRARHHWILRLDADEFPSSELKAWLKAFRAQAEPVEPSGYTCIWPLWDGRRAVTKAWPGGRSILFHRKKVTFFGMVEQVPIPDTCFEDLPLVLHHQPKRKSYGVRNLLCRRQAFHWRAVIAQSLLGSPTDLPRWRWSERDWPSNWQRIREHPLGVGLRGLLLSPLRQAREMWRQERSINLSAVAGTGLHHLMIGLTFLIYKRRRTPQPQSER